MTPLRIQLWSSNYAPEPTGIAPLSEVMARTLAARGHEVLVVAAHAHYPEPVWGARRRPYREVRDGVPVLRLPLRVGRGSVTERLRQEATFSTSLALASPLLPAADVIVAVSPSFPALLPTMVHAKLRRTPWVMWLQDILPDGAAVTGILDDGPTLRAARRLERAAYASAAHVVVISDSFRENLRQKGVADDHMTRIYNPASRPIRDGLRPDEGIDPALVLTMGNIGHTQNLEAVVRAFEADDDLASAAARLVLAGDGVAGDAVRAAVRTDRVRVTGVLGGDALEEQLLRASVALVSQSYDGIDFNVPSKLMNFMGYGLPVLAAVREESEVARIVRESGAGWVVPDPAAAAARLADVLRRPDELAAHGRRGLAFARRHFTPDGAATALEDVLRRVTERG